MSSALQNKNRTTNIFRIQTYDSIKYGYFLYWVYWFCACRKNPNWIYSKISRLIDLISRFNSKKSRFIKNQEAKELLNNLGTKTPLSKVPILGDVLFWMCMLNCINKWNLKQPEFTYSACGPFTKNKERIQQFKETGDTSYIYKNELDKASF